VLCRFVRAKIFFVFVLSFLPFFVFSENKIEVPIEDVSKSHLLKRQKLDWGLQFGGSVLDGSGLQAVFFPKDSLSLSLGAGTTLFTGNVSAGIQYYTRPQETWSPYIWGRYTYMVSTGLLETLGSAIITAMSFGFLKPPIEPGDLHLGGAGFGMQYLSHAGFAFHSEVGVAGGFYKKTFLKTSIPHVGLGIAWYF